jgi:hypothetical protein
MPCLYLYALLLKTSTGWSNNNSQIGLFSAIVTAFFVDSFSKLQPDDAAATNGLLSNLTDIILSVHGVSFNATGLPLAIPFEPERNDVRENVLWSISLALSVRQPLLFDFYSPQTVYSYLLLH